MYSTRRCGEADREPPVFKPPVAKIFVECVCLSGDVRDEDVGIAVGVRIADGKSHAAFGLAVHVERDAGEQRVVYECAVALIDPKLVGHPVVRDVEVQPAVTVEVGACNTEPGSVGSRDPRRLTDIGKVAVSVISEQPIGHWTKLQRSAIVACPYRVGANLAACNGEVDVVGDEKVEIAVRVIIAEGRARAPSRIVEAGSRVASHVREPTAAVVAI